MTPEEIARKFPEAVAFAREIREADPGVRLRWARNAQGEELGRLEGPPYPRSDVAAA